MSRGSSPDKGSLMVQWFGSMRGREKREGARLRGVGLGDGGASPPTGGLMKCGFLGLTGGFAQAKESAGMRGEYLPTSLEVSRATGGAVRRTDTKGSSPAGGASSACLGVACSTLRGTGCQVEEDAVLSEGLVDGGAWYLRKRFTTTADGSTASSSKRLSLKCLDIGPELWCAQVLVM